MPRASRRLHKGLPTTWPVLLLGLAMTATVALAASAAGPKVVDESAPKSDHGADPNLSTRVKNHVSKQLWKGRITAIPEDAKQGSTDDLVQLIEQIRAAQPRPRTKGRLAGGDGRSVATADPNASLVKQPAASVPGPGSEVNQPKDPNSAAQIQGLAALADPNAVTSPFQMAEVLVMGGQTKQAVPFYKKALALLDPQDKRLAAQRQWILLQLGRCLREDQPAEARLMLSQLISEYPESPWLDLARAWQGLADWYLTDQPFRVIGEAKPSGSGTKAKTP